MQEQDIICPECGYKIPWTEAISHRLKENLRGEVEEKVRREYAGKVEKDIDKIRQEVKQKTKEETALELADLKEQLEEQKQELVKAQEAELKLRKRERGIEEKEKNFELEMARKLSELKEGLIEMLDEEHRLEMGKKEKLVDDLKKQLEEAQKKAEQGSQQLQGEVLELDLEAILKDAFPEDNIQRIEKGRSGADLLQTVCSDSGMRCGSIIWEAKRTKSWSEGWIEKLRDDQRQAKADIAVIATKALPQEIKRFDAVGPGLWICHYERNMVIGLARALRIMLAEISRERRTAVGKDRKMEALYNYLTSNEFRQRIQGVVEAFDSMKNDLEAEKRAIKKHWAKREKQIERVVENVVSMHGELEGIGASLPEIESLDIRVLSESGEPGEEE